MYVRRPMLHALNASTMPTASSATAWTATVHGARGCSCYVPATCPTPDKSRPTRISISSTSSRMVGRRSDGPGCRRSALSFRTRTSRGSWCTCARSRPGAHARRADGAPRSTLALDPDEHDVVALRPDGEPHAIAGRDSRGVELCRITAHGHHLHGTHAERGHGLMANEQKIRRGSRDDLATDFVGRRTDDCPPEAGGKEDDGNDGEKDDEPARAGTPARRKLSVRGQW